jgi:hypothetical protein
MWIGCVPSPGPAPPPRPDADAAPPLFDARQQGDTYDQACQKLRLLRCDEGFDKLGEESCPDTMRRADKAHLAEMNPTCVRSADTVTAVKRCGPYCKKLVGYATE